MSDTVAVRGPVVASGPASISAVGAVACRKTPMNREPRRRRQPAPQPTYTLGEEIANSVTHGIGALLSIAGLVLLIVRAVSAGHGPYALASALVFGISLILEYTMSTLYHAFPPSRVKRVFRTFDHSCIFILIAGSYTPFLLGPLLDHGGAWMMAFIWALAVVGILFATIMRDRRPGWLQPGLCAVMGWFVIVRLPVLLTALQPACLWLLVAGGLSYTVGLVFYALKRIPYMHSIWHLWVMGGSITQFLAVLLFVL